MRLDTEKINEHAPYPVQSLPDESWVKFKTDYNVIYYAGFDRDDLSLPDTFVYQFSIINGNNKKSPNDKKVRGTIIAILENFFRQNNEVMLYICETGDGKQAMRNRLFGYWFNHYKRGWKLVMMSATLYDEDGIENDTAIILRQDHPKLSEIIKKFTDTVQTLRDKPTNE
ncbi:MAG: DUF6169 family protein [Prevotella sp.]|uniref:DUF6169 family protein n=1 Tax=Prevotella sp. AGR2160 TaxID=1280674 RepID=UPI000490EFC2|nr:DUF6169 family protein [Prevotella sp. AGR2160]MDD5861295.1 DUF6169 family protein [Prevotella sp.]